jgi:recombinational DNA repair protein (RecF pathway)
MQLSFLAELLLTTTAEREPNDSLFRLITLVLPLSTQPATSDMAQLYFEVWYLKLSGLFPLYRACHHCGNSLGEGATFVEPEMRRFSCQGCRDLRSMAFSRESWELLDGICRSHLASLSQRVPPNSALRELGGLVEGWLQSSFERSFQSLKLIRQAG